MEKRNTLLLTVIAVATLLVAVVGATFAYFASSNATTNNTAVNVTAEGAASFTSVSGTALTMNITAANMLVSLADDESITPAATSTTGTISATLTPAAGATSTVSCTYDLILTWNTEGYIAHTNGISGIDEFTLTVGGTAANANSIVSSVAEQDITSFNNPAIDTTNKIITLVTGQKVEATGGTAATNEHTVVAKFYNREADQSALAVNHVGTISVTNVQC